MPLATTPDTAALHVRIAWDNHFLTPFLYYCGHIAGPRPADVTEEEAQEAYKELGTLEKELQSIIRAYHTCTGALPVVGDELHAGSYYHRVPTEVRVARRLMFMANPDSDTIEVIYYLDCEDIKPYK